MEAYILTDRGVCCLRDQLPQWISFSDFSASMQERRQEVLILLGGVEYRQSDALSQGNRGDSALPSGFMLRQERLKGGKVMLMGVREDILRSLYESVPKNLIKSCIPFGLAVRSYLLDQNILHEGELCIVIHDAGERVFVTIIDGAMIQETRELYFQDGERLVDEVRRSEKRLLERSGSRRAVKIVSDHQGFIEAAKQKIQSDVLVIGGPFHVFKVLEKARFSVHFPSPAEDAVKRRRQGVQQGLLRYSLPVLLAVVSLSVAVWITMLTEHLAKRVELLNGEVVRHEVSLKERSVRTYQERVRMLKGFSWEVSFLDLIDSVASGWQVQSIVWESAINSPEKMSAFVLRGEEGVFEARGILKGALLSEEPGSGRPGLRIVHQRGKDI